MEIFCGFVQPCFFCEGSCIDDEYDALDVLGVGELRGRIVAELSVAGRVEQEEAARTLEGWVAWGAVVGGGGDVWAREEGFDGERLRRGVCLGNGVALGLYSVSMRFYSVVFSWLRYAMSPSELRRTY